MNQDFKKASFWQRFVAYVIDMAILIGPLLIINLSLVQLRLNFFYINLVLPIDLITISAYNTFFVVRTGSTIGKKILRLKVVDTNYNRPNLKQTLIRETIGKFVSGFPLGLGFLNILKDKNYQSWHDKLAKTYVVKIDPEGNPIIAQNQKPKTFEKILFYVLAILLIILIIGDLLYTFVGLPAQVAGVAMEPKYKPGQYVLVKLPFNIKRSDIVTYNVLLDGHTEQFMQRVIAGPGENILLEKSDIFINGKKLYQRGVIPASVKTLPGKFIKEGVQVTIPPYYYMVMGDNRTKSLDSRDMGFVPQNAITGKVVRCIWNCK